MNYFSQPKGARDAKTAAPEPKFDAPAPAPAPMKASAASSTAKPDVLSTFGNGMMITGNVVCAGGLQIYGRVTGEIHAAQLVICEGAKVEGKVVAQDTVVKGEFKGTIHGNTVKLQSSAVVDGEIFNRSLTIEQNAQFEGVSRRLDRPVDAPSIDRLKNAAPAGQSASDTQDAMSHIEMALKDIVA